MAITPALIAFGIFTIFTLGGGVGVVISRNLYHAALYLILSLFGIAGLYVILEAPFLAAIQVLVYLGAIAVLITITIMVTRRLMGVSESLNNQWPAAGVVSVILAAVTIFISVTQFGDVFGTSSAVPEDFMTTLGASLVSHNGYLLPFEVASLLLLAAMIGAIVVARE